MEVETANNLQGVQIFVELLIFALGVFAVSYVATTNAKASHKYIVERDLDAEKRKRVLEIYDELQITLVTINDHIRRLSCQELKASESLITPDRAEMLILCTFGDGLKDLVDELFVCKEACFNYMQELIQENRKLEQLQPHTQSIGLLERRKRKHDQLISDLMLANGKIEERLVKEMQKLNLKAS